MKTAQSQDFILVFALAIAYFVTARLAFMMPAVSGFATLLWAPTGISLAALFVFGSRLWPGVFLGTVMIDWVMGASFSVACMIGVGNILEAVIGATLLKKVIPGGNPFERLKDVLGLVIFAAGLSTALSATVGPVSLWLGGKIPHDSLLSTILAWWLGDALSVLIITPLLLTFHHLARQWRAKEVLEFIIFNFCTVVIGLVVFSNFIFHIQRVYPHAFLIFPLPIWVALRFRPPETAWGVFLLSVTASWGTAKGLGPFSGLSPSDRLILLQAFMGVVAVTALILCAAVTERTRSMNRTEFLSQASIILASSMNYEETLKTVSQLAVPELTDWCLVDILEDDGRIQRLAVSHADRTQASLASQLKSFSADLSSPDGIAKVIRTQQPLTESFASQKLKEPLHKLERVTDRSGALLSVSDPDQLKVIDKLSFKSYMSVPLLARDRILGALTFISVGSANPYCNEDLKVAQELARRSALAIDNSKLYKEVQKGIILRDDFISIASHELRTPLTSLKMQIHLMRQRLRTFLSLKNSSQDQLFKLLENSDRQVERLNHLIENVLNVSKITTGQLTLDKTEVDLTQLIRDILDGFELQVKLAKCTVLLEVQSNAKGKWDLIRIEEVVINLLTNAMKYGAGNPIQIQISSQDDWIAIAVQDYGVGISEADQKRIFNRFERVSSVKNIGGLGLGLYITREIIQAHGGFIEVKSELGKGSTFIVHLPLT